MSEDNDVDETMQDVDDGEGEGDDNGEPDEEGGDEDDGDDGGEGDGDEDEEGDDDQDEPESPSQNRLQARYPNRPATSPRLLPNGVTVDGQSGAPAPFTSPSPHAPSAHLVLPFRPSVRPEAITASTYDIVPTVAAPHSTSINAVTATPDMRWVFTGGTDGYIRKFHWPDTINGKLALTVAQKHPFVDSVTKAGVLLSYWENEETACRLLWSLKVLDSELTII